MKTTDIQSLQCNPFTMLDQEWCLIGVQGPDKFNAMTASWGGLGVIYNKNVATVYIRPQRFTRELIDANEMFTISFFGGLYKKELGLYGRVSGRDINKEAASGLHLVQDHLYTYFEEATLVFKCRKLYKGKIEKDGFVQAQLAQLNYPEEDYHYIYIAEIEEVLTK